MPTTINWNNIRTHRGSQNQGFEELCSQLFRQSAPAGAASFERRGYRDAGIECAHVLRDGTLQGMQAKYLPGAPHDEQWGQVDKSIKTAYEKNSTLTRLTFCIPQNFDDPKIPGQTSSMDRWKSLKKKWEDKATTDGRTFKLDLWGETDLVDRLTVQGNEGKVRYFFSQEEFTCEWFLHLAQETEANAGPRYSAKLNVSLPIADVFEGLGRTASFWKAPRKLMGDVARASKDLARAKVPEACLPGIEKVSGLASKVSGLLGSLDFEGVTALPLDELKRAAENLADACWKAVSSLREADAVLEEEWRRTAAGRTAYYQRKFGSELYALQKLAGTASGVREFARSAPARAANLPALLVSAAAGKGKTHLFTDVALGRAREGLPTLVLLGEHFANRDPLAQIMEAVRFRGDASSFLHALEAAAESAGGRVLVMIDALNEGEGAKLWPARLPGFLTLLRRHPRIAVALSVRTSYEEIVVPKEVSGQFVRVVHDGFASRPEEAARAFFGFYGLNLPSVPLLNPEYTDPLFLKTLCAGLQSANLHEVPPGYEGIDQVFSFLVDATEEKLRREGKIDDRPDRHVVREYLCALADNIASSGGSAVPLAEADLISRSVYPVAKYSESVLRHLLAEGLLSKEMVSLAAGGAKVEGIRFAYQRFGDHEIARRLLELHCPGRDDLSAFSATGPIGSLFGSYWDALERRGLLEALAIQLPSRLSVELPDLVEIPAEDEFESEQVDRLLAECFVDGLAWRAGDTVTERTFERLKRSLTTDDLYCRFVEVLVTLGGVPGHPLNAERLHRVLMLYTPADRDEWWLDFVRSSASGGAVDRLLEWSLLGTAKGHLSDASVSLVCLSLAWCTASTVKSVRDRATKGLVALLTSRPHLFQELHGRFSVADDAYVIERLYAAAYGVSLRTHDKASVARLAEEVRTRVFPEGGEAVPHLMVRDYARLTVERAVSLGCELTFDPASVRPPYGSALPDMPMTRKQLDAMVGSGGPLTDRQRAISHVVSRGGEFDISEYFGGPSLKHIPFSSIRLGRKIPPTPAELRDAWVGGLSAEQVPLWEAYLEARYPAFLARLPLATYLDEEDKESEAAPDAAALLEAGRQALEDLEAALSRKQLAAFRVWRAKEATASYRGSRLDRDLVARWVSQGALDRGWTADRFAEPDAWIERASSTRGSEHPVETAGAKYLWMSYQEVWARLSDNYYLGGYPHEKPTPYDGSWQLSARTVDPSLLPVASAGWTGWWSPSFYGLREIEGHDAWLKRADDLPDYRDQVIARDPAGAEWVALTAFFNWEEELKPEQDWGESERRNLWSQLRGYFVREADANAFERWAREATFRGRWMPEGNSDIHGFFLGELFDGYPWRSSRESGSEWAYQDWHEIEPCPVPVAPVEEGYAQSSDDRSTAEAFRCFLPSPHLMREGDLKWTGRGAEWSAEDGAVVALDPSAGSDGRSVFLVRRDFLDAFLARKGYRLFWTILGEKLVYGWDPGYPHLLIDGFAIYSPGSVVAEVRSEYEGRNGGRGDARWEGPEDSGESG
jgi:hypothetical protein